MRKTYQGRTSKANQKFEGSRKGGGDGAGSCCRMGELWEELQAEVEQLTGQAGLQIIRAMLEDELKPAPGTIAAARGDRESGALGPTGRPRHFPVLS